MAYHVLLDLALPVIGWGLRHYYYTPKVVTPDTRLDEAQSHLAALEQDLSQSRANHSEVVAQHQVTTIALEGERASSATLRQSLIDTEQRLIKEKSVSAALRVAKAAGWFRPKYPFSPLPIVSAGQSVTVIFMKDDVEIGHRRVDAIDLLPTLTRSGPPEEVYTYTSLDERGRFIYRLTSHD